MKIRHPLAVLRVSLVMCLILSVFCYVIPVKATTYVVDKTVTWGDASTEDLQIDTDYNVYLDGIRRNLVGMDINEDTPSGDTVYDVAELAYYDDLLTYLESIDVRAVHIQIKPWGTLSTTYSDLFDLAYDHKMFVYVLITCRWFMPVDLSPVNFVIDTGYYVDDFVEEACNFITGYDNILAISADNEMDLKLTQLHGAQTYTVSAATNYISLVASEISTHAPGIPITTKLVGYPDYGGFRTQCKDAFWPYVDFYSFDLYANSLSTYEDITEVYLRDWQNSSTTWPDSQQIWFGETNAGIYPSDADNFTSDYIYAVLDEGVNVIMLWTSYYTPSTQNGFFNADGSPKTSLSTLAGDLGGIQFPEGSPSAPLAPSSISATDGNYTDRVVVSWIKSTGATNYRVFRNSVDISGLLGDVATYTDTTAAAATITNGTAAASDGFSTSFVLLTVTGQRANNGTTYTYTVAAYNDYGSATSTGNTGYRGIGTLTYQWLRSAADSDAAYSSISATTTTYQDTTAPSDGSGRYYKVTISAVGASSVTTAANRGYRATSAPLVPSTTTTASGQTILTDVVPLVTSGGICVLILKSAFGTHDPKFILRSLMAAGLGGAITYYVVNLVMTNIFA